MIEETDTLTGDESLSLDQAAAAYAKATTAPEADPGQSETEVEDDSGTTDGETLEAEADGEETDGETEGTDQAEVGEDEPDSEQGRFVADNAKVRLPDGTVTTIADLKQGSLRQADYTRKTQEAAEVRKTAEAQSSAVQQRETQLTQREKFTLDLIGTFLREPDPSLVDPNGPNYDPLRYQTEDAQFRQWSRIAGQIQQNLQQSERTTQEESQKSSRERADAEWTALIEKVPELKDAQKAKAFGEKLLGHGKAYGFTEQELQTLLPSDHRFAVMARDAIKWRELQASKPKVQQKVEGRPPVQKGGKRLSPSENKARQAGEAMTRLGQTGRLDDAVAAYLATQK